MDNIFLESNLLNTLNINNNCLIDQFNINRRVLICNYILNSSNGNTITSSNYVNSMSLENANIGNSLLISYINITNDEFYKFRVRSGNNVYNGNCKVYINNYKNIILDKSFTNSSSETIYDVIKKGIYILCIDIPKTNTSNSIIPFTLEYDRQPISNIHPDKLNSSNWQSIDNLLLNSCSRLLNENPIGLVNIFFNFANDYCKNNINNSECVNFYNSINDRLINSYITELNNNMYPNPINGEYDPWTIDNTNWNSNHKNNRDIYGSCGLNASRTRTRNYYEPRYGGTANRQEPHTTENQRRDINCHTDAWTRNEWNALGSTNTTIPNPIIQAQFNSDITVIRQELNKFNKYSLYTNLRRFSDNTFLSTSHIDWINNEVSSFELTGMDQTTHNLSKDNRIYKNVLFSNNYEWIRDSFRYVMQTDGNLVCFNSNNAIVWMTGTSGNNNAKLCVTRNGRLIIYSANKTILWSYDNNQNAFTINSDLFYEFWFGNKLCIINGSSNTFHYGESTSILYPGLCYKTYRLTNGSYTLDIGGSNNLALRHSSNLTPYWINNTSVSANNNFFMQNDGNFVIYRDNQISGNANIIWASDTAGNHGACLELSDKGFIRIARKNTSMWGNRISTVFLEISSGHFRVLGFYQLFEKGNELLQPERNRIYRNVAYRNGFEWINGIYKLVMNTNGNLVLNSNPEWNSGTNNNNAVLIFQNDGNLAIYPTISSTANPLWNTGTYGINTSAYLLNTGFLVILNHNTNAIRTYPDILYTYLSTRFWNNSPLTLFSDKRGGVWKAEWSDLDQDNGTDWIPNDTHDYSRFRGINKDDDDSQWIVNERNLNHHLGYDIELNQNKPRNKDDVSDNYNNLDDRRNFNNDQKNNRRPPQLQGGIEKPNFIPGYDRISRIILDKGEDKPNNNDDTFQFLLSVRSGARWKQAYVLYRIKNRHDFANDILNNHKQLLQTILNSTEARNFMSNNILNLGNDRWGNDLITHLRERHGVSSFINKILPVSSFINKLNNSIKSNFINPEECDIKNIFIDENCSGVKFDQYKNYLSKMNDYCNVNNLNPECNIYISKEFIDSNNNIIKADSESKIKLLNAQESVCMDVNNILNKRCVYLNSKNPEAIQIISKKVDLTDPKFSNFKTLYGDEGLYQNCIEGNNMINNVTDCIKLESNDLYKKNIITKKKNLCKEDSNLLNKECIQFNKTNQIDEIKEECKYNKTKNCKKLCSTYSDEFNDICFWENNQLYIILVIIIAMLFGGFYMYKRKQNSSKLNSSNLNNKQIY